MTEMYGTCPHCNNLEVQAGKHCHRCGTSLTIRPFKAFVLPGGNATPEVVREAERRSYDFSKMAVGDFPTLAILQPEQCAGCRASAWKHQRFCTNCGRRHSKSEVGVLATAS